MEALTLRESKEQEEEEEEEKEEKVEEADPFLKLVYRSNFTIFTKLSMISQDSMTIPGFPTTVRLLLHYTCSSPPNQRCLALC